MDERRRDVELRAEIDQARTDFERCHREYVDLRRRGRNLRNWMAGLSLWLTALSLWGYSEVRASLDRLQESRKEVVLRSCLQHDAFVDRYLDSINDRLKPSELAKAARRDFLTPQQERLKVLASRDATLGLVEALQPRNPKRHDDHRPCAEIAGDI